jgi:YHS domain-containing protein
MMAAPWAIPLAAQSLPAPGRSPAPSGADPTRNVSHVLQSAVDRELQGLGLDSPPDGVHVASGELLAQTQRQSAGAQSAQPGTRSYTPPAGQMSEVQKHLQELYQQDGQPMPQMQVPQLSPEGQAQRQQVIQQLQQMPPSIATGRKANKPWDWLKPSTWRRRFAARNYTPAQEPVTQFGNSAPPVAPPMQAAPQRQFNAPQFGGTPQQAFPTQAAQQPRLFPAPGGGTPVAPRSDVAPQVTIAPQPQPSLTITPQPTGAPLALQPQPTPAQQPSRLDAFSFETPESTAASEFELELQPANVQRVAELEALLRSGSGAGDAGGTGDPSAAAASDSPAFADPAPGSDPLRNDFDPLADAFPEAPEAQADAQPSTPDSSSPFSGLRLDEDPFADPQPLPVPEEPAFADGPSDRPSLEVPAFDGGPEFQGLPMAPGVAEEPGTLPEIKPHRALPSTDFELPPPLSSDSAQQKMARIASRSGTGLKGFCPVMLRDFRELVDVQSDVSVIFRSREYWFSSEEAKAAFLADPDKYAPAADGIDLVHFNQTGEEQEGVLDYSVWYRGRLYLFATAEAKTTFQTSPREHATRE